MYKREEHEELKSWESSIGALRHTTRTRGWDGLEAARKDGRIHANQEILINAHAHLARTRGRLHVTSLKEIVPGDF